MTKRRIITLVLLVLVACTVGVFALRALPGNNTEEPPAQDATTRSQTQNNTNTTPSATNGSNNKPKQSENDQAPALASTGPEDSLTVFIVATILGMAVFNIWHIVRPKYLDKHSYK